MILGQLQSEMLPDHLKFGAAGETIIHPVVLVALLLAIALILFLPRKYVVVPVLLMSFLVPLGQQVMAGGFHLHVIRIVLFASLIRMLVTKRPPQKRAVKDGWDLLDKVFMTWAICRALAFVLLFREGGAVANQAGVLLDSLGGYFTLRFLIQDQEDIERTIKVLGFITVVLAAGMLNEHFRHLNVWGYLGGARLIPEMREGSLRAQGPFAHPLLAGSFGATMLSLFAWLWIGGKSKAMAAVFIVSSGIVAVMAASSTPILAFAAGIFGICMWPLRRQLKIFRWSIVAALVGLQVMMKAPVWFIIAHVDLVGGSSGYHRARLIDQFIRNFFDWWLVGTNDNGSWGWDMWDTSNQFVQEGESGGLVAFVLFLALIVICFKKIGNARKTAEGTGTQEWFYWLLGTTLFAHIVAFFGVTYFDQTKMLWFAVLSIIVAATASVTAPNPVPNPPWKALVLKENASAGKYLGPAHAPIYRRNSVRTTKI
jgi:hypothetical protein